MMHGWMWQQQQQWMWQRQRQWMRQRQRLQWQMFSWPDLINQSYAAMPSPQHKSL